jgi:hypothetical protein
MKYKVAHVNGFDEAIIHSEVEGGNITIQDGELIIKSFNDIVGAFARGHWFSVKKVDEPLKPSVDNSNHKLSNVY